MLFSSDITRGTVGLSRSLPLSTILAAVTGGVVVVAFAVAFLVAAAAPTGKGDVRELVAELGGPPGPAEGFFQERPGGPDHSDRKSVV